MKTQQTVAAFLNSETLGEFLEAMNAYSDESRATSRFIWDLLDSVIPKWTSTPPNEVGFYLVRSGDEISCVGVRSISTVNGTAFQAEWSGQWVDVSCLLVQWAGPMCAKGM